MPFDYISSVFLLDVQLLIKVIGEHVQWLVLGFLSTLWLKKTILFLPKTLQAWSGASKSLCWGLTFSPKKAHLFTRSLCNLQDWLSNSSGILEIQLHHRQWWCSSSSTRLALLCGAMKWWWLILTIAKEPPPLLEAGPPADPGGPPGRASSICAGSKEQWSISHCFWTFFLASLWASDLEA